MDDNHIGIVCRIRPLNAKEGLAGCVTASTAAEHIILHAKPEPKTFTFDYAAGENTPQEEFFSRVGVRITDACIAGYNGTILCYGQTGSGKTHTIFGDNTQETSRGLVPRVLEYLWSHMSVQSANIKFVCKCSFYEIYQERVYDLLTSNPSATGLNVREDSKLGVYVEGVTEELVTSPTDAQRILAMGYANRHVGETAMNRESSRSHAVFQLHIQTTEEHDGISTHRNARFSMVDLAGSERQKDTNASGDRLKEASQINKSLSALGNVINALADVSNSGVRRHIHYRDSKLTFLLRDSLGGNSKTVLIATVSPAECNMAETLSTLKFAQRAKSIQNTAVLNEETSGALIALQQEIAILKNRLMKYKDKRESFGINASDAPLPDTKDLCAEDVLLRQALERCQAADEMRLRTQLKSRDLCKKLDQADKNTMALKMKIKMRDSEIARYKKKSEEEYSTDEIIRVEVDAVRQELQAEVLKYRLQCDEYERRNVSVDWSEEKENLFQHDLLSRVVAAETRCAEMQAHLAAMGDDVFVEKFGFTVAEAAALQAKAAAAQMRCDESKITQDGLTLALNEALRGNQVLEKSIEQKEEMWKNQLKASEEKCEELNVTVASLLEEIFEKNEELKLLRGDIERTDVAARETQRQKELEHREEYNTIMKDNTVLLHSCRRLEATVEKNRVELEKLHAQLEEAEVTQQHLAIMAVEHDAAQASAKEWKCKHDELNSLYVDLMSKYTEMQSVVADLQSDKSLLQDEAVEMSRQVEALKREVDRLQFELTNSQEDADSLYVQAETLTSNLRDVQSKLVSQESESQILRTAMEDQQAQITATEKILQEVRDVHEQEINSLNVQLQYLQDTNASLGSELASSHESLAKIETAHCQLNKNYDSLQTKYQDLVAEVEESKESLVAMMQQHQDVLNATAERDAATAVMISDLKSSNSALEQECVAIRQTYDTQVTELLMQVSLLNNDLSAAQQKVVDMEASHIAVKQEQQERTAMREKEIKVIQASHQAEIAKHQASVNELQDEIKSLQQIQLHLSDELNQKQEETAKLSATVLTLEEHIAALTNEYKHVQEESNASITELNSVLTSKNEEILSLSENLTAATAANNERELIVASLEDKIKRLESALAEKDSALSSAKEKYAQFSIQLDENKQLLNLKLEELGTLQMQLTSTVQQNQQHVATIDELERSVADKENELSAVNDKYSLLTSQIEESKQLLTSAEAKSDSLDKKCCMIEIAYETMKYQLHEEETKVANLEQKLACVEEERSVAIKHFDDIRAAIRQTTGVSENADVHSCVSEATQEMQQLRESLASAQSKNAALEAQITEQSSLQQQYAELMSKFEVSETKSLQLLEKLACLQSQASDVDTLKSEMNALTLKHKKAVKHAETLESEVTAKDSEVLKLTRAMTKMTERQSELETELQNLHQENAKLCGHRNNKQKIQLHMQLKKEMEDQNATIRHLQEQVAHLTLERDASVSECEKLRHGPAKENATRSSKRIALKTIEDPVVL